LCEDPGEAAVWLCCGIADARHLLDLAPVPSAPRCAEPSSAPPPKLAAPSGLRNAQAMCVPAASRAKPSRARRSPPGVRRPHHHTGAVAPASAARFAPSTPGMPKRFDRGAPPRVRRRPSGRGGGGTRRQGVGVVLIRGDQALAVTRAGNGRWVRGWRPTPFRGRAGRRGRAPRRSNGRCLRRPTRRPRPRPGGRGSPERGWQRGRPGWAR
jgi:hypothetical protein